MNTELFTVRLSDASTMQVRGQRYSLDSDTYPGAASRYRSAFRLIIGSDLTMHTEVTVLEVTLWDEETGELVYTLARVADSPEQALRLLDQFDPCAYLPQGHLQPNDLPDIRSRHDERARRFRAESLAYFASRT